MGFMSPLPYEGRIFSSSRARCPERLGHRCTKWKLFTRRIHVVGCHRVGCGMLGKSEDFFKSLLRSLKELSSLWWGFHGDCVGEAEEEVILR